MSQIPGTPEAHNSRLLVEREAELRKWPALLDARAVAAAVPPKKRSRSILSAVKNLFRQPEPLDLAPYRRLALQLHFDLPRESTRRSVLLVTAGKSDVLVTACAELARCVAEEVQRPIVLVDAAPSTAALSKSLSCVSQRGFADWLAESGSAVEEFVLPTSHADLSFLAAGTTQKSTLPPSPELIGPGVRALEERWDFVLLSGGAVLSDTSALAVAPHVGCVLLVVVEDETTMDELEAARKALQVCKVEKIGLVLTKKLRKTAAAPQTDQ